jgi:glycerol-3-phosphate dehydrogenase
MSADLVVIGGGVTGAGVARDAAMRGFRTILVERADIAQGTSGRFHGLLHSGARYVVSDPRSAIECAEESDILRRIQSEAIEDTGGYFVQFAGDDPGYADRWVESALAIGLPFEEIGVDELLKREPRVNPSAQRAMHVADGSVDGWRLAWGAVDSARAHGAQVLSYMEVCGIDVSEGRACAVRCRDRRTDDEVVIDTGFVINAAGP